MRRLKKIGKITGIISAIAVVSFSLVMMLVPPVKSYVQTISGLAVAQTSTQWNNVKDAAVGDAQTSGLMANGMYVYDPVGATWNRMRGTAAGVMSVSLPNTGLLSLLGPVVAPTVGATQNVSATAPVTHTWTVVVLGAPANQSTNLEGSIDGSTWYVLDTSTTTTSEMRHVAFKGVLYVRANCTALDSGTMNSATYWAKGN